MQARRGTGTDQLGSAPHDHALRRRWHPIDGRVHPLLATPPTPAESYDLEVIPWQIVPAWRHESDPTVFVAKAVFWAIANLMAAMHHLGIAKITVVNTIPREWLPPIMFVLLLLALLDLGATLAREGARSR